MSSSLGHAGEPPEFEQRGCGRVFLVSDQLPEQGAGLPGVVCLGEHRGRRLPLCGEESALASTRTPSRLPPSPLGGPHGRHTAGLSSTASSWRGLLSPDGKGHVADCGAETGQPTPGARTEEGQRVPPLHGVFLSSAELKGQLLEGQVDSCGES